MSIKSTYKWIETPDDYYKTYLLIETCNNSIYYILSDEDKGIIYRAGFFEAGGDFKVYKYYKSTWIIMCEGFGSPTIQALHIGNVSNIYRASTNYNIYDLFTGDNIIEL